MKKTNYLLMLLISVFAISSCKDDTVAPPVVLEPAAIANAITANTTLTSDRVWILKGETHVQSGAVLTIQPGTVIKSDVAQKGALIIDKGGRIEAAGTAAAPIVFTSGVAAGSRAPGDWAGITIIGRAPTNRTTIGNVEGGVSGTFGTENIANDNSGTLRYVRIEYAGVSVSQGSEVNALSFYAVGSGTTVDYVQVSYAKDDAFEFFGGTVNAKHLISYGTADDDFDFDFGYIGRIQYGVSIKRPELADAADQSNGIECDNENPIPATGPSTPLTRPVLSNFTFVGTNGATGEAATHFYANRFRRATQFVLNNSIIIGFKEGGFSMESSQTATGYLNGQSSFKNNLVSALKDSYRTDASAAGVITTAAVQTKAESEGCVTLANSAAAMLGAPFNLSAPSLIPNAGSPALAGTWVAPETGGSFFTTGTFRGAFGANDTWANAWTNFTPNTTTY